VLVRVALFGLALLLAPSATAVAAQPGQQAPEGSGCAAADAALQRADLGKARQDYLDVLASEPSSRCALDGLNEVTAATRGEERLCAEGKAFAEAGKSEESRQAYAAALRLNLESECASKGLAPPSKDKEKFEEWVDLIPKALLALGGILAAGLLALAVLYLLWVTGRHLLRPSLRIDPFLDDGIEPKVGAAVAAMVGTRLHELSSDKGKPEDGYQLDLVGADIELFAADKGLSSAVEGFAEVPHLQVLVALLSSAERLVGWRSFVASGDLAPAGEGGDGIALALHRKNSLHARRTLWATPAPSAPEGNEEQPNPAGFYELVVPAAAWVQYEVAAQLDSRVRLLTANADSWSHLGRALDLQRQGQVLEALDAYADALALDPDNVGALANLGVLIARQFGLYREATLLLFQARQILVRRYGDWE
jgi:tetratricopeptide (TPR) repeat protein